MAQVSKDFEFDISPEFIESGKNNHTTRRKGGPYSKDERIKRQNEVYRLHFEYGYSARKISELMKINRNTVNGDVEYWYGKISNNVDLINPERSIMINTQRLNVQRTRLRERLDKAENFQQIQTIEKMIFEVDCKITNTQMKLAESTYRILKEGVEYANDWLKEHKKEQRRITMFDSIAISKKAKDKISKIIKEDKKKNNF